MLKRVMHLPFIYFHPMILQLNSMPLVSTYTLCQKLKLNSTLEIIAARWRLVAITLIVR